MNSNVNILHLKIFKCFIGVVTSLYVRRICSYEIVECPVCMAYKTVEPLSKIGMTFHKMAHKLFAILILLIAMKIISYFGNN